MVFESLVVDLVNKYLGDFIENLDKSQLKIGIWGGDVVLNNLFVKESALDDLDLPIKVLHGNLGKLVLKIPWKNLYTEPTVATLDGLYVVAVPNAGIKYNAEKEAKYEKEVKQKELDRIEEAKKAQREKNKAADPKADTFAEKLATQVIKNLQVTVSNIHIRYEDHFTNPSSPISIGVTLKGLSFQTTDANWKPTIIKDTVTMIYKMVKLESLALYWNSNTQSYLHRERQDILNQLKTNIVSPGSSTDYQYLIEPISSSAQLRMHTKPEMDEFSLPKILLNIIFEEIAIALTKKQYQDVMEILESLERMNLASKYRKHKPDVPKKGNASAWWHFAYKCVMEETVLRRKKMWSWDHIKEHRQRCRDYKAAYKQKLTAKKVSADVTKTLEDAESKLTVFNITLLRQQAEVEAKKEGAKRAKEEKERGWFGGWFGGGKKTAKEEKDLGDQFQELMSADEKSKLYEAIGYQENAADPTLPKEFVANKLNFNLKKISLTLKDMEQSKPQVVQLALKDVAALMGQRPAANAIKLEARMDSLTMFGAPPPATDHPPTMVSSQTMDHQHQALLDFMFETNPLDGKCDQRVVLNARPLEIIYDANTINQVADFFKPPESVHLKQLQAAAMAKFEDLKDQTATGLAHAIEHHKFTDISVDLKPTHVIIPETGVYRRDVRMIVLDLGNLKVNSGERDSSPITPTSQLSFDEVMEKAYEKFNINLKSVQLLFVNPGDDWKTARTKGFTPMHILKPLSLNVGIEKSILHDPKMPKMRLGGELPSVGVAMSDARLHELLQLIQSIPFPESEPAPPEDDIDYDAPDVKNMTMEGNADALLRKIPVPDTSSSSEDEGESSKRKKLVSQKSSEFVNSIDMELKFEIKEICVQLSQRHNGQDIPMVKVVIDSLGTQLQMCTFDMKVKAYLGGIYVQHTEFKVPEVLQSWYSQNGQALTGGPLINLVNTPIGDNQESKLLMVEYIKANKKGPEFSTTYKNTEQKISVHFTTLELLLHQEALVSVMDFAQKLQPPPATTPASTQVQVIAGTTTAETATEVEKKTKRRKKIDTVEIIDVALDAKLDTIAVAMCTQTNVLADVRIKGLESHIEVTKSSTAISAALRDIIVFDPSPDTLYRKILSIDGREVFHVDITVYNGATEGDNYSNMEIVDTRVEFDSGTMKIIFLNKFVTDLLRFLDAFQAAKENAAIAASAMAESAAAAAQDMSSTASRISLNVHLKAPVIIAPQSSKSTNALMIDLGHLTLSNNFHLASGKNSEGIPAVLDKMSIHLTELKVSRALVKESIVEAECLILEPVNISLYIARNLAASWFKEIPDIDISGNLEAFAVCLSQGDFTVIMSLLSENLAEPGQMPVPSKASTPQSPDAQSDKAQTTDTATVPGGVQPKPASGEVHETMKFNFTLKTINATLFSGDNTLTCGVSVRDISQSLGKFELQTITVEGNMNSDTSMKAHVILHQCVLTDSRPGKDAGITRMVERASHAIGQDSINMIDVNFVQTPEQDKDITVGVNGLYICVCLEYLMSLGDFFTKGMPQQETPKPETAPAVPTPGQASASSPASAPPAGSMRLALTVNNPEIVLVEDSMDLDTNALIMDTHVVFEMRITPEVQKMSGNISQLCIISCSYALEKRKQSQNVILDPTDITLYSSAPTGQGMHIAVTVSDLVMNVSPATIRQVTATLSSMSPKPVEEGAEVKEIATFPGVWAKKKLTDCDFWFLKTALEDVGDPLALQPLLFPEEDAAPPRGDQLMLTVNKIIVKLEGGIGNRTVPLLITEMTFTSEVKNWSTQLFVGCDMSMEVAYYNERLAVWEPLIEPVETEGKYRPWELGLQIQQNEDLPELDDMDEADAGPTLPPPKMSIKVSSADVLQTTITKSCLEVLGKLGQAFSDAYNLVDSSDKVNEVHAPYIIKNESGLAMTLKLDEASFKMPESASNMHVGLMHNDLLALYNSAEADKKLAAKSVIKTTQEDQLKRMAFILEDLGATRELKIVKAEARSFGINQKAYPGEVWNFICQTEASYGCKTITFRSMLQIKNYLPFTMEAYYGLGDGSTGRCGEIASGKILSVPLEAVYAAPYELFFKPMAAEYKESKVAMNWKNLKPGVSTVVTCEASKGGNQPLHFNVISEVEDILLEYTGEKTAQSYLISMRPTVLFRNFLPLTIEYLLEGMAEGVIIEEGQMVPMLNAKVGETVLEIKILNYMDKEWTSRRKLDEKPDQFSVWTFEAHDGSTKTTMDLGLHFDMVNGCHELSLYCPYWMINKTGRTLTYKATDDFSVQHVPDHKGVLLFSFKSKSFFAGKKKASLKVGESDWSDKFSLDVVGSSGTVSCKFKGYTYEVGVRITLSSFGLTKIINFTPFFILINQAPFTLCCKETASDAHWCNVPAGECVPFWPMQMSKNMQMSVKVKDKDLETMPFCITQPHSTLLPLQHDYAGIYVEVQVMESCIEVKLQQYQPGLSSALLVNHTTNVTIQYAQNGIKDGCYKLGAGESINYTWQDALGKRELIWSCEGRQKELKDDLVKDGIGEIFYNNDNKIYWVSFLDGMQRVLLFTDDLALATLAQQAGELEQVDQEIIVSLQGLGLSLVNNYIRREVAYLAITSSGVIWEFKKKKRFKALKIKQCMIIEAAFQQYQNAIMVGNNPKSRMTLEGKIEVDFGTTPMMMYKPSKGIIQRSFENGIWLQYRTSPHQIQFHSKIHRLQLDSQLPGAVFPSVLAPVPLPKSIAAESVPKPFTEISVMIRKRDISSVMQFKYCKVLIQEMAVKVDQGFLNALILLFAGDEVAEDHQLEMFKADVKMISTTLMEEANITSASASKNYYDILHFSPLKIHLSFSMYGGGGGQDDGKPTQLKSNVLNLFLQSVGVVLSDVQDVIFKLGYFERNYQFYNQQQLTGEVARHYSQQAIKQMYVLVLGLDVLGNPFGVIRGLAEGLEDLFYEPYQGAIQGPEEFAEGLALGVRSLFGHAVGGAAGAVSRITGALGKGIATLTLDDDYQKKRREQMAKKPTDLKEGLARGGKGLVMGVVDGVTGIVRKPVEGARQEGVEGFFKGMGKGLVGVFTRPASGVIDFASTSFEGIKRATEFTDEVHRVRPPRFLHSDGIVRPYIHREAEGNDILRELEKGRFAETDSYLAHVVLTKDMKNVLLVTDKRVVFASKGEIFGHWDCEWSYVWSELKEVPSLNAKGIQILLKEKQKKSFFSSSSVGKMVPIQDRKTAEWLVSKMKEAMQKSL